MAAGSSSVVPISVRPSSSRVQLQELRHEIEILSREAAALGMNRTEVCFVHFCVMDLIDFLEKKVLKEGQVGDASCNQGSEGFLCPVQPNECLGHFKDFSSSMDEDRTSELRYLFVSNGCAICLLDLKQSSSDISSTPPVPKIATLNLIEKGLPVSVGLFKLQSEVYMIGGQMFPANVEQAYANKSAKRNPSSCDLYKHLCSTLYPLKGTSRFTFRLSAADNGTISFFETPITKMNSPKIWPIVEEIHGALHVFDSDVTRKSHLSPDIIFSHEVLECEGDRFLWRQLPTSGGRPVQFHLVMGHCIYALAGQKALLFDSRKGEWEERAPIHRFHAGMYKMRTVWDIIAFANARCVLQVGPAEAEDKQLYVVIALGSVYGGEDLWRTTTKAVAYLVNSVGEVVLIQDLPQFFEGQMQPAATGTARVIKADEEGKTMCSIVKASGVANGGEPGVDGYLFINTFAVKELLSCTIASFETSKEVRIKEFVRVEVKDRYIFKIDEEDAEFHNFVDLQACFI